MKTKLMIAAMLVTLDLLAASIAFGAEAPKAPPIATQGNTEASEKVHVATCRDGKEFYSTKNAHIGACRGHGGVASWADGSPVRSKGAKTSEYR